MSTFYDHKTVVLKNNPTISELMMCQDETVKANLILAYHSRYGLTIYISSPVGVCYEVKEDELDVIEELEYDYSLDYPFPVNDNSDVNSSPPSKKDEQYIPMPF